MRFITHIYFSYKKNLKNVVAVTNNVLAPHELHKIIVNQETSVSVTNPKMTVIESDTVNCDCQCCPRTMKLISLNLSNSCQARKWTTHFAKNCSCCCEWPQILLPSIINSRHDSIVCVIGKLGNKSVLMFTTKKVNNTLESLLHTCIKLNNFYFFS